MGWPGLRCVQLDPGSDLKVRSTFVMNQRYAVLGFDPNKRVFLTGPRNTAMQTFCLVDKTFRNRNVLDYKDHGAELKHSTLMGMRSSKDHESFQIGPSGSLRLVVVPWGEINSWTATIDKLGGCMTERLHAVMSNFNEMLLDPVWYERLCAAFRRRQWNPYEDLDGTDFCQLMCMISQAAVAGQTITTPTPDSIRLTRGVIDLVYEDTSLLPLKLSDFANSLHASSRTIQDDTNKQVGMGPLDLVRLIRMQQVRRVLTHQATSDQFGDCFGRPAVKTVFEHFKLSYSNRTIAGYKCFFGKSPKQDQMDSLKSVTLT